MLHLRPFLAVLVISGADANCELPVAFKRKHVWRYFSCTAAQDDCRDLTWDTWQIFHAIATKRLADTSWGEAALDAAAPDYVEEYPCEPSNCYHVSINRPVFHLCPVTCGTCDSTSIGGYTIVPGKCVAEEPFAVHIGKTLPECVHLCDQEIKCLSFEYIQPHTMPSEDSKCLLKDSVDYEGSGCTYRNYLTGVYDMSSRNKRWTGDLYLKPANRTVAVSFDRTVQADSIHVDTEKAALLTVLGHFHGVTGQANTGIGRTACWFVLLFITCTLALRLLCSANATVIRGKFAMKSMRMWRSKAAGKYDRDDTEVRLEVNARIGLLRKKMSLAFATIALIYTIFNELQNHLFHSDLRSSVNLISNIILLGYILLGMGNGYDHSKIMAAVVLGAFASLLDAWAVSSVLSTILPSAGVASWRTLKQGYGGVKTG